MTYGVGMLVEDGLVMIADTRTNAGVDNISVYRKLHLLIDEPGRLLVCATAGNLSITQMALAQLEEGLPPLIDGGQPRTLRDAPTLFRAAQLTGEAMAMARHTVGPGLAADGVSTGVSMLFAGRIATRQIRLYLIYEAGNFIECQSEQPFLQIGDIKYGKPILDRSLTPETPLDEAVKIGLISFDSTMRSNLAVGRPLDLLVLPTDPDRPIVRRRIQKDDRYFNDLSARWSMLLNEIRATIPPPPFMTDD